MFSYICIFQETFTFTVINKIKINSKENTYLDLEGVTVQSMIQSWQYFCFNFFRGAFCHDDMQVLQNSHRSLNALRRIQQLPKTM